MAGPVLTAVFFKSNSGREPVRDWLSQLDQADKKRLGRDIRRLQLQWPVGMPKVRKIEPGLWELRTRLSSGTARIVFTVYQKQLVALHGFVKKTQKLPVSDLNTARKRLSTLRSTGEP